MGNSLMSPAHGWCGTRTFSSFLSKKPLTCPVKRGEAGQLPIKNENPTLSENRKFVSLNLARREGFEPPLAEPESAVLPLDDLRTIIT